MRRLLAIILAGILWLHLAPSAHAAGVAGLVPCSESPAYQAKSQKFRNTTADPRSGQNRAALYAKALCGPEGYPHLIVDGRLDHAGEFLIPSLLFLYIAGWIGWAGRSYLIAIRSGKDPELKEIIIDVPLAIGKMIAAAAWPATALAEFTSGKLIVKDSEVPTSPR